MKKDLERVDLDGVTLIWGDRTEAKAVLRDESVKRHLTLPLGERLRLALSMVRSNGRPDRD